MCIFGETNIFTFQFFLVKIPTLLLLHLVYDLVFKAANTGFQMAFIPALITLLAEPALPLPFRTIAARVHRLLFKKKGMRKMMLQQSYFSAFPQKQPPFHLLGQGGQGTIVVGTSTGVVSLWDAAAVAGGNAAPTVCRPKVTSALTTIRRFLFLIFILQSC